MATLKEDSHSCKASSLEKRDYRHSHDGPEELPPRKTKSGKKSGRATRRWCRGKEGREHTLVYRPPSWARPGAPKALWDYTCDACGMSTWNMPDEVIAQIDPRRAQQLELAAKWCGEGHLYDTTTIAATDWSGAPIERRVRACVMCGKRG